MIGLLPIILFVTTGIYETVKIALLPIILFVTTDIYEKVKICRLKYIRTIRKEA
jgi:hypothetical protein